MFLLLILIFFIVFIGVYWFVRRTNKVKQKRLHQNLKEVKGLRIGLFALSSLSLIYIYSFNTPGNLVKAAYNDHAYWIPYSQEMNYYNNGFVGGFLYNLNVTPMEKTVDTKV